MYGASKVGRGGGSAGKRNIHAPQINRPATTGRLPVGGGHRGRGGASSAAVSPPSTSALQLEENFSLVRENPLNIGMAIKLTPDLVEEIKRVEAQGGTARMKFDANASNANGNIIHVGDKYFKFTWSREPGDLCDIYEERQSGEDGNGLLLESGGTWRKLNLERELDESTQNHMKRISEEAERNSKSRKAIILDPQNPSTKNQLKAFAASESNPRRGFINKKEPPSKKPKFEPPAGGPPKSVYKPSLCTTTISKVKLSSGSPLPLQPDQHGAPATPVGSVSLMKGHVSVPDCAPAQNMNKTGGSDKEKSKYNWNTEAKPTDLRSLMISLLLEHQPNGMSLKALEKAIGDTMPNSARQIEPILKQIATFRAPGRYFLKPAVELESFKKPPSQSGRPVDLISSPEINRQQSHAPQKVGQLPAQDPSLSTKAAANDVEQDKLNSTPLHAMDDVEKIDILHNSPEQFTEKKVSNITEGLEGSSSDSGSDSDSDSDSSDSGSDSGSHSRKSRSPAGSQSGSSSDSDSDASSSSKQASDEDVDIMTSDDDKESKHKLPNSDCGMSKSPVQWGPGNESVDIGNYDDHVSDVVEIEKDSPEDDHVANKEGEAPVEEIKASSTHHHEQQERQVYDKKAYDGPDSVVNDVSKHGQSVNHEKSSKPKSKRRNEGKHPDERTHSKKKLKSKNPSQPVSGTINSIFGDSPNNSSPDRPLQGLDKGACNVIGYNQVTPTRFASDSQPPGQRSFEARIWNEVPSGEKLLGENDHLDHGAKHSERSPKTNEGVQIQKGFNIEEGVADKHATMKDLHYRKPDTLGRVKEAVPHSNSYTRYSPKDNNICITDKSPPINGRGGRVLQRELSELELGEFREPFHEETPGPKKQNERKSSSKQLENKPVDSDYWNSDFNKGKPSNKITADPGKLPPLNSVAVTSGIQDGPSKSKAPEHSVDDLARSHKKGARYQDQHVEVGSQHNKVTEMSSKSRFAEAGKVRLEANGDTSRKVAVTSTEQQPNDLTQGVARHTTKESKKQKPNMAGDSNDRRKSASLTGNNDGGQKKKGSSSDDNSSYNKYEKEEPELKGPIKNASQYKEYVKEYQEKYESYCSLNKILETYRDDFSKLGKDLEAFKGRDMKRYHDILEQMRSSFRQCGERHKRLKKIFLVLYEELKHLKQMIKDYAASYRKD